MMGPVNMKIEFTSLRSRADPSEFTSYLKKKKKWKKAKRLKPKAKAKRKWAGEEIQWVAYKTQQADVTTFKLY